MTLPFTGYGARRRSSSNSNGSETRTSIRDHLQVILGARQEDIPRPHNSHQSLDVHTLHLQGDHQGENTSIRGLIPADRSMSSSVGVRDGASDITPPVPMMRQGSVSMDLKLPGYLSTTPTAPQAALPDRGPQLGKRRNMEFKLVQHWDRLEVNSGKGEFWYMINTQWMERWIQFAASTGPLPGPITNLNLFRRIQSDMPVGPPSHTRGVSKDVRSSSRSMSVGNLGRKQSMEIARNMTERKNSLSAPRRPSQREMTRKASTAADVKDLEMLPDLQPVKHYRALHPMVWYIFVTIYGSDQAPELTRYQNNIYDKDVATRVKVALAGDMQLKAQYEVRKFSDLYVNEHVAGNHRASHGNVLHNLLRPASMITDSIHDVQVKASRALR